MKAFGTDYLGVDGIVFSEKASKSRYAVYLSAKDAGYSPILTDIRVFRLKDFDNGKLSFGGDIEFNMVYCAEYILR